MSAVLFRCDIWLLRHFGHLSKLVLKLAITAFTSLYFQTLWPNSSRSFKKTFVLKPKNLGCHQSKEVNRISFKNDPWVKKGLRKTDLNLWKEACYRKACAFAKCNYQFCCLHTVSVIIISVITLLTTFLFATDNDRNKPLRCLRTWPEYIDTPVEAWSDVA